MTHGRLLRATVVAGALAAALGLLAATATAATPKFVDPVLYPVALPPIQGIVTVGVSDLNRDGKPDIVWAGELIETFSVRLGTGSGTFGPETSYPAAGLPKDLALADVNEDGADDVVLALGAPVFQRGAVAVALGRGDGSFGPPARHDAGIETSGVAVADVNGDGSLDVAVSNFREANSSVFLGDGSGGLGNGLPVPTRMLMGSVALHDLNRDGRVDLLNAGGFPQVMTVSLGNGDGTFQAFSSFPAGGGAFARAIAIDDLNRDGHPDAVVDGSFSDSIGVLLGNGDGTLQPATSYFTGTGEFGSGFVRDVALADVDGDGFVDAVAASANGSFVSFLEGRGDGSFAPVVKFLDKGFPPFRVAGPQAVVIADLNGDRINDLVVAQYVIGITVLLAFNPDVTPPNISTPVALVVNATSPSGAVVTYVASATDDLDPSPSFACTPPSGAVFPIGTTTVTCAAIDASGNTASASFDVHVKGAEEQLRDLFNLVTGLGPGSSLADKIRMAQAALDEGDRPEACQTLTSFENEAQAQAGKKLTSAQATELIDTAARIRAVLDC